MIDEQVLKIHVTPDLPREAKTQIKSWKSEGKYNGTFYRVLEQFPNAKCKNCSDAGFIMVSFTRAGPFNSVPNHKPGEVLTWFDGNAEAGKGWYIVTKTISYPCHRCEASNKKEDEPVKMVSPETIESELGKQLREWAR